MIWPVELLTKSCFLTNERSYKLSSERPALIIVNGNNVQEHEIEVIIAGERNKKNRSFSADIVGKETNCPFILCCSEN